MPSLLVRFWFDPVEIPQVNILVPGDHNQLSEGICFPNLDGSVLSAHGEEQAVRGKTHGLDSLGLEVGETVAEDVHLERC